MALINCSNCGRQISDNSNKCIHCGYSLQEYKKMKNTRNLIKTIMLAFKYFFFIIISCIFSATVGIVAAIPILVIFALIYIVFSEYIKNYIEKINKLKNL